MQRLTILLLAIMVFAGCRPTPPPLPPPQPPTVTVALPLERELADYRDRSGWLEAIKRVEIRARVRGFLQKVYFQEGADVKKGDVLYQIDPREYEATVARAKADLAQTRSVVKQAKGDLERATRLRQTGAVSEQEYQDYVTKLSVAEASVQQMEASLYRAELDLSFTKIVSPIDGRVSRTLVNEGNLVGYNDPTLLTTIVSMDPLYVFFEAPERDYLQYQRMRQEDGLPAASDKRLPLYVGLDDEEGYPHEGYLDFSENQVDRGTGTLLLRGVVPNPKDGLRPGLYARVRVPFGKPKPRLLVPEQAISADQRGDYLLIVNDKNVVDSRVVKTGMTLNGFTEIVSGLDAKDHVVVNGLQRARQGVTVKPEMTELQAPEKFAIH